MATALYQCAVSISTTDGSKILDVSSMYGVSSGLTINQKNTRYRGVSSLDSAGQVFKDQIDQENTWTLEIRKTTPEELTTLMKWYEDETNLNISILFKSGELAGKKLRLTDWGVNTFPMQTTINGTAQSTQLTFSGFNYNFS